MLKYWPVVATGVAFIAVAAAAVADGGVADLDRLLNTPGRASPLAIVKQVGGNGDVLRLTSNKDEILRLDEDAASIIVNNPVHASVMLDSPRLLIIMPREPGATSFSVLNARGEVILHKDIIVSNVQPQYVRIRRMCSGDDASCVPAAYFYCPDGCYEVTPVTTPERNVPPPPAAAAAALITPAAPAPVSAAPEEEVQ